jgi:7,8-dihydroneopterin aldolase/epimerase/oxygenase
MTPDTSLAFAHPEDRAVATAVGLPDRISLRDHVVAVDIGAFQPERGHTQRVKFNVVVEVTPAGDVGDDVDKILSYDRITWAIAAELAAERLNLLETLAERVAARILAEPQALRVFVRIEKLDVGPYALGVEIVRAHGDGAVQAEVLHPLVVHLDNAMIVSGGLAAYLDSVPDGPVVLTVGLPDVPRGTTGHKPTQRRIDLLAIEQNAWMLAARDARCVVVNTRTEIDWAMKHSRMVVWAPSKMVLDAVDGPMGVDGVTLCLWLAETLQATGVIVHGDVAIPAEPCVPVMRAGLV